VPTVAGGTLRRMRFSAHAVVASLLLVACGATIPKAELDRCKLGVADGNDAYTVRQGAACGRVAKRLAADERPVEAMGYGRKACELQDARGCLEYLAVVRSQPSLPPDELMRARATGEKACAGMVVGSDGTDARPAICARTAELYQDVEPRSASDAGRLYARACKLGDDRSCARATALGISVDDRPLAVAPKAAPPPVAPPPPPLPRATATAAPPPPAVTAPSCHEMRPCVSLDVQQRNTSEIVGTLTNHCSGTVTCTWCPSRADQVDKGACHSATLAPGEARSGQEAGLWYDGYNALAYDCMGEHDAPGCLGM